LKVGRAIIDGATLPGDPEVIPREGVESVELARQKLRLLPEDV
jgi:hypothetical protein